LNGHILLAEDNPANQKLISTYILKTGLTIDVVENGKLALEKAISTRYDMILMDIQMPVMDGLESIKRIRQGGLSVPIVCLTANAMKEDMKLSFDAGADEYLTKPIDFSRFNYMLSKYISSDKNKSNASEPSDSDSNSDSNDMDLRATQS
jgi:CheY-like chemotaxis protein